MELKELVPSIELCKLIPKGEFEDSCFAWCYSCDKRKTEPFVDYREYIEFCRRNIVNPPDVCPAPTLEEIIKELGVFNLSNYYGDENLYMCDVSFTISEVEESPVIAAFKCWLKTKGIEV